MFGHFGREESSGLSWLRCTQSEWAPAGAWQDLWNALNAAALGQNTLNFATNVRFVK